VPPGHQSLALNCVVVAWNGSIEAIRALHGALPLLRRAKRIVLLTGTRKAMLPPVRVPEFALEQWCRRHELPVEFEVMDDTANQGAPILEAAHAATCRPVGDGRLRHSRFSEARAGRRVRVSCWSTATAHAAAALKRTPIAPAAPERGAGFISARIAPVDHQFRAGDELGFVRSQVHTRPRRCRRLAHVAPADAACRLRPWRLRRRCTMSRR
jgi:hypothetical protein